MNEIKFRGRNGDSFWYYSIGNSTCTTEGDFGVEGMPINEVDVEEWKQFTGVKDKNDIEVYDGDNVKAHMFYFDGRCEAEKEFEGVVVWNDADYCWAILISGELWEGNWHSFAETSHYESDEGIEVINSPIK